MERSKKSSLYICKQSPLLAHALLYNMRGRIMIGIFDKTGANDIAFALRTLSAKNDVISRNIANQSTPGYKSSKLVFKEVMGEYFSGSSPAMPLKITNANHLSVEGENFAPASMARFQNNPSVRNDGNDVNIDYETTQQADTEARYTLFAELAGKKLTGLKDIIKTRS